MRADRAGPSREAFETRRCTGATTTSATRPTGRGRAERLLRRHLDGPGLLVVARPTGPARAERLLRHDADRVGAVLDGRSTGRCGVERLLRPAGVGVHRDQLPLARWRLFEPRGF